MKFTINNRYFILSIPNSMDLLTALEDKRTHYTTFKVPINEGMDPDFIYIKI